MDIFISQGITQANKVLKYLKRYLKKAELEMVVYSYCNGREHGYQFRFYQPKTLLGYTYTVAESRNSDSIVVYPTKDTHMSALTSMTDEDYRTKTKYFHPDEANEAAKFIANDIKNQILIQVLTGGK